jgi:uncharacterized Fe-S radical SAM superfamily protein PflX
VNAQFWGRASSALESVVQLDLSLPLVFNCEGDESRETLQFLDGVMVYVKGCQM